MKKLLVILFVFVSSFGFSQNLVPNPSFEDYYDCPMGWGESDLIVDWVNIWQNSTDYYNTCSSAIWVSVPNNYMGYQLPYDGEAFAGLLNIWTTPNNREVISCTLNNNLIVGHKYYMSMKVNPPNNNVSYSNNIGILFTTYPYYYDSLFTLPNFSHLHSTNVITDTLNWTSIAGSFIADSTYQYLNISNFYDDANTNTINAGFGFTSYYYIDMICISEDSLECFGEPTNIKTKYDKRFNIYPNPTTGLISITNGPDSYREKITDIEVFDIYGKHLTGFENLSGLNEIDLSTQPKGIYIIKVRTSKGVAVEKIVLE